jgi:hypothetical protein
MICGTVDVSNDEIGCQVYSAEYGCIYKRFVIRVCRQMTGSHGHKGDLNFV